MGSMHGVISDSLSQYWLDNRNSPVSSAMIWDAAKATLRGHLISYTSNLKRVKDSNRKNLEEELSAFLPLEKLTSMLASAAAKQMINVSVRPSGVDIGCVNEEIHPSAPDLDELDEFL
ncbi:hypothetical protein F2P79_018353 [Pimephales promelas]|nr:hypothetical protein F2P79_018353 [Pimephales promelas]